MTKECRDDGLKIFETCKYQGIIQLGAGGTIGSYGVYSKKREDHY